MSKLSRYISPSTGEECTGAQYVAELVCQQIAQKEKLGTLGYKFWNTEKWKKIYIREVTEANKLVKQFGETNLVKFIHSWQGKKILALRAKWVRAKIEEFAEKIVEPEITVGEVIMEDVQEFKSRPSFGKNTLFSKLKEIDGGKKEI